MATSDKTKKLQLLGGGFATKKQLEEQYIKTYVLDEGETAEDAPEWAEEVVDPFSESEGGSGVTREEFDELSEAIDDKANKAGWTPDKYIGTDAEGNLVEKDAPEGGGGSGGAGENLGDTLTEVQIATGTIAAGTAAGKIDTGITVGDLRQYKMFAFRIRSTGNSPSLSGNTGFGTRGTNWNEDIYFGACACALFVIKWIDNQKTQGKVEMAYAHSYGANAGSIGESLLGIKYSPNTPSTLSSHNTCFCSFENGADDALIYITLSNEAPGDFVWEVRGMR